MWIRGVVVSLLAAGCNQGLDEIEGYDLGNPSSAAWAKQSGTDQMMIVASSREDICAQIEDPAVLETEGWTLFVWSLEDARYEADLPASALAIIRDGVLDNNYIGDGTLLIDDADGDLDVHIDMSFGSDRVNGRLRAEPCDTDLFAALPGQQSAQTTTE